MEKTRLYKLYTGINKRCYSKNRKDYERFGAKGIRVSRAWKDSYASFRAWALGNGYNDKMRIKRIDPEKNYSPTNCYWERMP